MLYHLAPSDLERWYSQYGTRARYHLSSSAAPSLTTAELLRYAGPNASTAYLELNLNYGPAAGSPLLRRAISTQYSALEPDHIQITTGAAEALFLVLNTLIQPGDLVVVQHPIYPSIVRLAEALGAQVRRWSLSATEGFDLDDLTHLVTGRQPRAIILNNPHSPTGQCLSTSELRSIAELAASVNATLVVDEVYRGIHFGPVDAQPAADNGPHVVSIGDVAKPYGLGGVRIGWIATANKAFLARCAELRDYTSLGSSVPGEFLATIALEHRGAILEQHLAVARRNRALFVREIAAADWLDWQLADSGFTLFPRANLPQSTTTLCRALCERYAVLLLPGEVFEMPGYVRIGFGVDSAQFAHGLERVLDYATQTYRSVRHM